jgi:hypothetical protein
MDMMNRSGSMSLISCEGLINIVCIGFTKFVQ